MSASTVVLCLIALLHRVTAVIEQPQQLVMADDRSPLLFQEGGITSPLLQESKRRFERSLLFNNAAPSSASCSEPSEISENTIIRTKDSRALGARFLNETSLGSDARDRCMALCCAFHGCNVAVYEEKDGGNCYLFDCGPVEDFRCKFTSHSHYTSGVIRRRDNNEAHEEELTQLKKIPGANAAIITDSSAAPVTQPTAITVPPAAAAATTTTVKPGRTCSRYQFECHTTFECIAIYNACDGIIQCSDGSDEAPELGCPAATTESTTTKSTTLPPAVIPIHHKPVVDVNNNPAAGILLQRPVSGGSSSLNDWRANRGDRDRFGSDASLPNVNSIPEGNRWRTASERDRMRVPYQPVVADSAAVYPPVSGADPDRSINPYYNPDTASNHRYGTSYGRDQDVMVANEYRSGDLYGDRYNNIYDKDVRLPLSSYDERGIYPSVHKQHDWERNNIIVNSNPAQLPAEVQQHNNPALVDRPFIPQQQLQHVPSSPAEIAPPQHQVEIFRGVSTAPDVKVKAPEHVTTTTTLAPVKEIITTPTPTKKAPALITKNEAGPQHAHINHFHVNQVDFQEERAERSRQTVGAVWALTLGISVTAVLVLLVGCRLRSLKSRLRRGRGGHARDADYLVNGMYL